MLKSLNAKIFLNSTLQLGLCIQNSCSLDFSFDYIFCVSMLVELTITKGIYALALTLLAY